MTDPTSPSEPVESREQPSSVGVWPTAFRPQQWWRDLLAERDATIRNLETLRDVHRRTIDDLISEAQTAGATIDGLRAERQAYVTALVRERDTAEASLAAAVAEVSRLREQAEAVRRLADQIEVEIAPFHSDDETVVDRIRAALGDARRASR